MLAAVVAVLAVTQAQPTPAAPEPTGVDYETVITGSRSPRLVGDGAVATEVIRRQDIEESGAENVATLLEDHPGLDVTRSFAGAGIRIQGFDPQYVLILVDGERVSGRVNGTLDLARFTADDIERIEIVRGPSSALYGSEALGGVINIITRKSKRRLEAEGHARYGYGSPQNPLHAFDTNGRIGAKLGGFNLKLSGGYHRQNPFSLVAPTLGAAPNTPVPTTGNGFWQGDAGLRAAYKFERGHELVLRSEYVRREQNGLDLAGGGAVIARFNSTETFQTSLSPILRVNDGGELRIIGSYSLFRDQSLLDQRGSTQLDQYNENWQHLGQLQLNYAQRIGDSHTLTVGAEGFFENNRSARLGIGVANRGRSGVYVQDEWQIVKAPNVVLTPGVRLDGDTQFGAQPTPKIALRIDPIENLTLRLSYGWGFRAPSFNELYLLFNNQSVGYTIQGNPDLRPELSQSLNLGGEYTPAKWVTLSLSLYRNDLENLIATRTLQVGDAGQATLFGYVNIARARTQGIESLVSFRPTEGLRLDVGYTLLDAKDLERNRRLDGRAEHRGNFLVSYTYARWGLHAMTRGSVVSDRVFYFDANSNELTEPLRGKPYVSMDVRLAKRFDRYFEIFMGVDNVFGAGEVNTLPLTPRLVYAGVTGRY